MKSTLKCEACGHAIKNPYTWDGKTLGIECWKKVALPEIERQRKERDDARFREVVIKSYSIVGVLQAKDLSKISNQWKLDFIASVIEQVQAGRPLSQRQREIAKSFFNNSDWARYCLSNLVLDDMLHWVEQTDVHLGLRGKLIKLAQQELGELPAQTDWYGEPMGAQA